MAQLSLYGFFIEPTDLTTLCPSCPGALPHADHHLWHVRQVEMLGHVWKQRYCGWMVPFKTGSEPYFALNALNGNGFSGSLFRTVDGREIQKSRHEMKPWLKPLFVGIYRGIESFQGFSGGAKWISSIHSRINQRRFPVFLFPAV